MGSDRWRVCANALGTLWTVGGRLRAVYNGSKRKEERRKDRRATWMHLAVFAIAVVVCATVDSYGDLTKAVIGVARGVRLLWLPRHVGHV